MGQKNQYAYADAASRNTIISESDLNITGAYSGSTQYAARDVVLYSGALYIALAATISVAPVGNHSTFWSSLVLIRGTGTISVPSESFTTLTMKCPDDGTQHTIYLRQADGAYTIEIDPTPL